jgi:hypothetical protein
LWWLGESDFGGSLKSGGRFCVVAFGRNIFNLVYKEFFKFCIFSATYKENAVNFIIFQQK